MKTDDLKGLFFAGTDTGVGKTQVAAALIHGLCQRGLRVRPRKPVESGVHFDPTGDPCPEDALTLSQAAGNPDPLEMVCPYPLRAPISPERAAALEQRTITLDTLAAACRRGITAEDFLLVEGAGGFYSPLAPGGLNADLAVHLGLPVVLVVDDRLGCINHTLLSVEAIRGRGLALAAVVLNRVRLSPDGMDNHADLQRWLGLEVLTLPPVTDERSPPWRQFPGSTLDRLVAWVL